MNTPISQTAFLMLIFAPTGCGKSTIIRNFLEKEEFLKGRFDHIYLFSPSRKYDPTYNNFNGINPEKIFNGFNQRAIEKIADRQEANLENGYEEDVLLILDDCITENNFINNARPEILELLAIRGRNMRISTIITTQKMAFVSKSIRNNANHILCFGTPDEDEIKVLYRHYGFGNKKKFLKLYEYATREPFNFLFINVKTRKYYRNFNEIII